ncbi:Dyp-type peroxidase domain-containing protein [Variovorax saccharolyticus]|uniref:Dyp-type peroxidase domain-containing protein n=1 Tax=Variovorax saccharolyticus TaxID=3053516 RepID=UPI002576604D|nr:Dyp-type peroxidase domain-containing protein [Variovorax sp. J31P216]MDM0028966.1 Dyp-type peroxidase [Variovorax sp. J31P216]
MQRDVIVKARRLGGSSDLTILAPVRPGLVDSLDTITFKTRVKRVLDVLHGARQSSHEFAMARWVSDAIERVEVIQSVRVAVLEPQESVMLAVSFDGGWESYIRVLWARVGTLLDLIFCNTIDYVTARDHSFDEWMAWVRVRQVETGFFYGPPDTTWRDALFQRNLERLRQGKPSSEVDELRAVLPSPTQTAHQLAQPQVSRGSSARQAPPDLAKYLDQVSNGIKGVAALYRLNDMYPPTTGEGAILRHAALDLLLEFVQMHDDGGLTDALALARKTRFERQIDWLFPALGERVRRSRELPPAPDEQPALAPDDRRDIQGGILRAYEGTTHGAVLLLAFDRPDAAAALLDWLDNDSQRLARDDDSPDVRRAPGGVFRNLAWTLAGLRAAGLDEDMLAQFPDDFRQGMALRCGQLGDVHNNHPRRWRLPSPLDPVTLSDREGAIEMEAVHAVFQWRCAGPVSGDDGEVQIDDARHPLNGALRGFVDGLGPRGVRVLAVQPMRRRFRNPSDPNSRVVEHFGYEDGSGQPEIDTSRAERNRIHVGEIILGHDNAADFGWRRPTGQRPQDGVQGWLFNGSFLAMRKYRQFPSRLEHAVATAAKQMGSANSKDDGELVYAKLMGRWRNGKALVPSQNDINNFTYDNDAHGQLCPLHAHIRRAHPRPAQVDEGLRTPRLMRRSMAYGPPHIEGTEADEHDKGLVFMAYNASLGEQFEVVQRWLVGGNSTGNSSATSCPIVGVPSPGIARHFRFEAPAGGPAKVIRVALEPDKPLLDEPATFTRLEWGLYLFAPSLTALQWLKKVARQAADVAPAQPVAWECEHGRTILRDLLELQATAPRQQAIEAWKAALQDTQAVDRLDAAALWAAIREDHGGLLTTPYGHLVTDREWVHHVLQDPQKLYSLCGHLKRMERSFGPCYLGMDDSPAYRAQSDAVNQEIMGLEAEDTYEIAWLAATHKLDEIVKLAQGQAVKVGDSRYQTTFEAREVFDEALAALCEAWYGLQDDPGRRFRRGPVDWFWQLGQPPLYPGHFHALSRSMFQPHPGPLVRQTSERYGQALREAMAAFVQDHLQRSSVPQRPKGGNATLAAATMHALASNQSDPELAARTMVGVLMGFIPTISGAVANVLHEWQRDHRFESLRSRLSHRPNYAESSHVLGSALHEATLMRPMPQVIWRTALADHRLGDGKTALQVAEGDRVVLGLVSGTQQSLADGNADGKLMFGGIRQGAHPTHACPGYQAAMGAMLGMLAALLARSESLRAEALPSNFLIEGTLPPQREPNTPGPGR